MVLMLYNYEQNSVLTIQLDIGLSESIIILPSPAVVCGSRYVFDSPGLETVLTTS